MNQPASPIRHPPSRRLRRRAAGFTLIEAALTTIIVGTGVLAIVAAQQAYHMQNDWAQRTGTGMLLANEIRELTLTMPMYDPIAGKDGLGTKGDNVAAFNCVADFAGSASPSAFKGSTTFTPPIDARRETFSDLERWRQTVTVRNVWADELDAADGNPPTLADTDVMRVTVDVHYREPHADEFKLVTTLSWIVTE